MTMYNLTNERRQVAQTPAIVNGQLRTLCISGGTTVRVDSLHPHNQSLAARGILRIEEICQIAPKLPVPSPVSDMVPGMAHKSEKAEKLEKSESRRNRDTRN